MNVIPPPSGFPQSRWPSLRDQIRRYLQIYVALWRNSVTREMTFKTNFLLWIVVELLWFALQLCFIEVIYLHTDAIGTWTRWEVILLVGTSHCIQEIFQAFFLINCANLSDLVRTGKLDFLLLQPVNARFLVSLRQVDLGSFVNAGIALVVMVYAMDHLDLQITPFRVLTFTALCLCGILIHYSLMFLLAAISFWTIKAQGIVWGYYNLFQLARMPDEAFRGMFRFVFTFIFPVLLVTNVPVRVLIEKLDQPAWALTMVLMAALCLVLSEAGWRVSLRHYTSASS
ncbi:MAG: ABC-2 family transporter protein [Verrucomicrobiota bacterium]|nr:ABC-2 family transporter protein [Limisphaera sp.]MDW8381646.1 ABC-2 family transporter protein [Verrucomicrobiota bacterium]